MTTDGETVPRVEACSSVDRFVEAAGDVSKSGESLHVDTPGKSPSDHSHPAGAAASRGVLDVRGISKTYTTRNGELVVLREVDLTLLRGQSLALLGPSGSGKSTLLNILGTLESPSTGEYTLDGVDPFSLAEAEQAAFRNKKVGFVFQEHHLLPQLNALENVLLPALMATDPRTYLDRARELLERVGLAERMNHHPAELSGGERQRVALARALIHRPALLLADEPTGNLDRRTTATVADLLLELHRSENNMLVVVTHAEDLAQRFQKRFALQEGRLVERA